MYQVRDTRYVIPRSRNSYILFRNGCERTHTQAVTEANRRGIQQRPEARERRSAWYNDAYLSHTYIPRHELCEIMWWRSELLNMVLFPHTWWCKLFIDRRIYESAFIPQNDKKARCSGYLVHRQILRPALWPLINTRSMLTFLCGSVWCAVRPCTTSTPRSWTARKSKLWALLLPIDRIPHYYCCG